MSLLTRLYDTITALFTQIKKDPDADTDGPEEILEEFVKVPLIVLVCIPSREMLAVVIQLEDTM